MNELALFAGAGGGLLASKILGWSTVCAVEIGKFCQDVILHQQQKGNLDTFPIWDDVQTFDGKPWRGLVDIISGGFPCQDVSTAGKRLGVRDGKRSGLWKEFARIIGEVKPPACFIENVQGLVRQGMDVVLQDLADMGYHAAWCCLGSRHVGGLMRRDRIWIVAHNSKVGSKCDKDNRISGKLRCGKSISKNTEQDLRKICEVFAKRKEGRRQAIRRICENPFATGSMPQPLLRRGIDELAGWVDRVAAVGNGQDPEVAVLAYRLLSSALENVHDSE